MTTTDRIANFVTAPYSRIVRRSEDGTGYEGWVLELPGVYGGGETATEVNDSLDEAMAIWIEHELEQGHDIPKPMDFDAFSGRLTLRIPPSLHERAYIRATVEGLSLNRLLESLIAHGLGESR